MYCINGVGSGVGPILARRWTGDRDKPLRISISIGYLIGAIGLMVTAPLLGLVEVLIGGFYTQHRGRNCMGVFDPAALYNAPRMISEDASSVPSLHSSHSWEVSRQRLSAHC